MSLIPDSSPREQERSQGLFNLGGIGGFWRRRWKRMAAAALLVFVLSLAAFLSHAPKYTATARMMMIQPRDWGIEQIEEGHAPPIVAVESQLDVLRSHAMIGRLVDALGLQHDPEWNRNLPSGQNSLFDLVRPPAAQNAPRLRGAGEGVRETVVKRVAAAIIVSRRPMSNFVEVSATAANPQSAAQMANRLVELYIEYRRELRVREEATMRSELARYMPGLRDDPARKREALDQYRAQTNRPSAQGSCDAIERQKQARADEHAAECGAADEDQRLAQLEGEAKAAADVLDALREALRLDQSPERGMVASLVSRATAPAAPSSPNLAMAFLVSIGLGLVSGLVVGLLAEFSRHSRIARLDPVSA